MGYRHSYNLSGANVFANDMRNIVMEYYLSNGERKKHGGYDVDLMYTIIDDLEKFTNYGHRVTSIPDKSAYLSNQRKKDDAWREKNNKDRASEVEKTLQNKRWAFEWERMAKNRDYFAMVGVPEFIREVENILNGINERKLSLKISYAIETLASKNCGDDDINRKNKELATSYKKALDKDLAGFSKLQTQDIEKNINRLKETSLYKQHSSKGRLGDNRFIGKNDESVTFAYVFDHIRTYAKSLNITEKNTISTSIIERSQDSSLTIRLDKLKKEIDKLKGAQTERVNSHSSNKCELSFDELDLLQKMDGDINGLIGSIEVLYDNLKKKEDKYKKILIHIDAIKTRRDVISDTLVVLNDNSFRFPNTQDLLNKEVQRCDVYLKKNETIIREFNDSIKQIEKIISEKREEIERITPRYSKVVLTGVERKEKTRKEKEVCEKKSKDLVKTMEKEKEYEEWQKVEKVKEEVESTMHPGEGFFPEQAGLYKGQLSQSLHEHNIPAKPEYLSSTRPSEKVEYHVDKPKEEKKLDSEGFERLRKSAYGGYEITQEFYDALFNKFERELISTKGSFSYGEVYYKVIDYIAKHYGDEIANRKQYEEIKKTHLLAHNTNNYSDEEERRHSR